MKIVGATRTGKVGNHDKSSMKKPTSARKVSVQPKPKKEKKQRPPFAARLVDLRAKLGETQVEVAVASGISRSHYAKLETGGDNPSLDAAIRLSRYFGVTLNFLATGVDSTKANDLIQSVKESDELELLKFYRSLGEEQKAMVMKLVRD